MARDPKDAVYRLDDVAAAELEWLTEFEDLQVHLLLRNDGTFSAEFGEGMRQDVIEPAYPALDRLYQENDEPTPEQLAAAVAEERGQKPH